MADAAFRKNCLDSHNAWRKKHGVSPLKLNDDINKVAQKWAEHLAKHDEFAHSKPAQRQHKGNQMGENIAMKYTSDNQPYTGEEATNQWYSEIERFNFGTASGPSTGHFTQVVWKACTDLGVGKAQTKSGKWLVVANYHPAGNFVGDYKANVLPPVSGKVEVPDTGADKSRRRRVKKRVTTPETPGGRDRHHKRSAPGPPGGANRNDTADDNELSDREGRERGRNKKKGSNSRKGRDHRGDSYYVDDEVDRKEKSNRKDSYFIDEKRDRKPKKDKKNRHNSYYFEEDSDADFHSYTHNPTVRHNNSVFSSDGKDKTRSSQESKSRGKCTIL